MNVVDLYLECHAMYNRTFWLNFQIIYILKCIVQLQKCKTWIQFAHLFLSAQSRSEPIAWIWFIIAHKSSRKIIFSIGTISKIKAFDLLIISIHARNRAYNWVLIIDYFVKIIPTVIISDGHAVCLQILLMATFRGTVWRRKLDAKMKYTSHHTWSARLFEGAMRRQALPVRSFMNLIATLLNSLSSVSKIFLLVSD